MDTPDALPRENTVLVGGKRTIEYTLSCLSLFNRGHEEIELAALGDSIAKAATVAQTLANSFGIQVGNARFFDRHRNGWTFTGATVWLRSQHSKGFESQQAVGGSDDGFISLPFYQLLFDQLLRDEGELIIGFADMQYCLRVVPTTTSIECSAAQDLQGLLELTASPEELRRRANVLDGLVAALYRAGFLLSTRWEEVALKLGQSDDIVLGLDTNILFDCVVTQQLLDAFGLACNAEQSPNWVLLVVPSTVMHEIEQAANSRDDIGQLSAIGRMGYRALQEILELDQSSDIRGVSLLIVGDSNPVLDAREELRGLREDFKRTAAREFRGTFSRKMSSGDTLIRDQFKGFLRQLSFHKGTFFLTADKSNSALGQAEGLHSLYFPPPHRTTVAPKLTRLRPPRLMYEDGELEMGVIIGKLLYELAVQFGSLRISSAGMQMRVDCDSRGDSLEHWVFRDLRIATQDVNKLLMTYTKSGSIPLANVDAMWRVASHNLAGW